MIIEKENLLFSEGYLRVFESLEICRRISSLKGNGDNVKLKSFFNSLNIYRLAYTFS